MAACSLRLFKTEYVDGNIQEVLIFENDLLPDIQKSMVTTKIDDDKGKTKEVNDCVIAVKLKLTDRIREMTETSKTAFPPEQAPVVPAETPAQSPPTAAQFYDDSEVGEYSAFT